MHSRNQQLIADAARLVVMAHGGVSGAEQDPTQLFDLLEEGVRFTVVQPETHRWRPAQPHTSYADGQQPQTAWEGAEPEPCKPPTMCPSTVRILEPGESPGIDPRGLGGPVASEAFFVAYNEQQRSCGGLADFPDPCEEYKDAAMPIALHPQPESSGAVGGGSARGQGFVALLVCFAWVRVLCASRMFCVRKLRRSLTSLCRGTRKK